MKHELEKNKDLILEVLDKGIIYYYNRIGKVVELSCNCVTSVGASCNLGATKFYFKYEDFTLCDYNPHPHIKGAISV